MKKRYHTRILYEKIWRRLKKELGSIPVMQVTLLSDYELLLDINEDLQKLDCVTFTELELGRKLS